MTLRFIDKWGPGVVSIITLLGLVAYAWINGERVSRLEGMVQSRLDMEIALRLEIQTWQAHTVKLREVIQNTGASLPALPEPKEPSKPDSVSTPNSNLNPKPNPKPKPR